MKVSISMCTFNGAHNVLAQLQSFSNQTRLPDELVIYDDCSQDETVAIIREFAKLAPFPVILVVNELNVGFVANFAKSLSAITGDIAFLSDQDDVWLPEKLEKILNVFQARPDVGLVFCDANLVDSRLLNLGQTWWQSRGFGRRAQNALVGEHGGKVLLKDPSWMAAGATMAFRAYDRDALLPIPQGWTHDAWISTVISSFSQVGLLAEPLNNYRQHDAQVFGAKQSATQTKSLALARGASPQHFLDTAQRYVQLRGHLSALPMVRVHAGFLQMVDEKVTHCCRRAAIRTSALPTQLGLIFREFSSGRYFKYSQGIKSIALDCWTVIHKH